MKPQPRTKSGVGLHARLRGGAGEHGKTGRRRHKADRRAAREELRRGR